jgi:hypothetical protein
MTEREVATLEGFRAGYVEVAGLPTWHEVRGEGPAVVLERVRRCAPSGPGGWKVAGSSPGVSGWYR